VIYAVRVNDDGSYDLWSSEDPDRTPPDGFMACGWRAFRTIWSERDGDTVAQLVQQHARRQARRRGIYPAPDDQHPSSVARAVGQ
jgi:hypothetical protein